MDDLGFFIDSTGNDESKDLKSDILSDTEATTKPTTSNIRELLTQYKKLLESSKSADSKKTQEDGLWKNTAGSSKSTAPSYNDRKSKDDIAKLLKKSVITSDFENLKVLPPYDLSDRKRKEERKREREKTKGKKWYGMPATEMTEEIKNNLEIIKMRSVLDPKNFYKKNDMQAIPKYFQMGKVIESHFDYHNNHLTRKTKNQSLVDQLLTDVEFRKYNKRKYAEIITERQKTHYKAYMQAKKLKRKKK